MKMVLGFTETHDFRGIAQPWVFYLAVFLVLSVLILARSVHLSADVPNWFAPVDIGLHIDEGYKTYAAKNLVSYGAANWNQFDQYSTWIRSSPLTQWGYYTAFTLLGTKIASARLLSVGIFALILIFFVFAFRRDYSPGYLLAGVLILALEPFLVIFSRVALFEIFLALFTCLGLLWVYRTRNSTNRVQIFGLVITAGLSFTLVKASGVIYLAPSVAALALLMAAGRGRSRVTILYACVFIAALAVVLYFTKSIWLSRIKPQELTSYYIRFAANPSFILSPLITLGACLCILDFLRFDYAGLYKDPYRVALAATIVGVPLILAIFPYSPPRYYGPLMIAGPLLVVDWIARGGQSAAEVQQTSVLRSVLIALCSILVVWLCFLSLNHVILERLPVAIGDEPGISGVSMVRYAGPAAIAAGLVLAWLRIDRSHLKGLMLIVIALFFLNNLYFQGRVLLQPTYQAEAVSEKIGARLEKNQSIIGDWAPYFGLIADRRALYSNNRFNPPDRYELLKPDFFIHSHTENDFRNYQLMERKKGLHPVREASLGTFFHHSITLYRIEYKYERNTQ